jgi:hypothetical protein
VLPPCVFDSTKEIFATPLGSACVSPALTVPAIPTPLWAVASPPDRSVQPLSLPQARRIRFATRSGESFRQPWNCLDDEPELLFRQPEKGVFQPDFNSFFMQYSSTTYSHPTVNFLCINQRPRVLFACFG